MSLKGFFTNVLAAVTAFIKGRSFDVHYEKATEWTGYKTMKNRDGLIDAICRTYDKVWIGDKEYAPKDGTTYCNFASADIAEAMGCMTLRDKLANEIATMMETSPDWQPVPMDKAQALANSGSLVFAIARATGHGHICVVRPGLESTSGKWGVRVPAVMNIGKDCFIGKGVNWAFQSPPDFYVWKASL